MSWKLKLYIPFLFALLFSTWGVGQPLDLRLIKSYTVEDFKNSRQSWAFEQTESGQIIVGNSAAINLFDGVNWSYTHVPKGQVVFSLDKSPEGRIYAGGSGEIGYLIPDSLNRIDFKSLTDKIDSGFRAFTQVRQTHYLNGKVYFRSLEALFIYDEQIDTVIALTHKNSIYNSYKINNRIYVNLEEFGLVEVKRDEFVTIENTDRYGSDRIYGMLAYDDRLLIYSREHGLNLFDGVRFEGFGSEVNNYLMNYPGYRMMWMDEERIAIGTLPGGLVIINKEGKLLQTTTTDEGLNNNYVYGLYMDQQKLLWVALDDGISVFDTQPEFKIYDTLSGISGSVLKIFEKPNYVIIITNQGAFKKDKLTQDKFSKIQNTPGHFYSGLVINGTLYGASSQGLYKVSENYAQLITENQYLSLVSNNEGGFYGISRDQIDKYSPSSSSGLSAALFYDQEILSGHAAYFEGDLFVLLESGSIGVLDDAGELISMVEVSTDKEYQIEHLKVLDSKLYLGTRNLGLFEYSARSNAFHSSDQFKSDHIENKQVILFSECDSSFWFRANRKVLNFNEEKRLVENSLYNNIGYEEGIFTIDCGIDKTWFGGENKIYSIPHDINKEHHEFLTNITGIYVQNDSLIYGGFGKPVRNLIFPYKDNELRFTYAAASYINPERNQYQIKLEGFDQNWSNWTSETQKDYTNIPEGDYTFLVRSKNVYDVEGSTASISFSILPPWYRTWWAYLLYTITIAGILYTAYKIRVNQLLRVERIRNNIASDLHDEVSATLSSISYFAQAIQSDKMKKDKDRFVKLIANSAGDAKEKITDIVWAINPEHDDWQAFLSKCRRYASDLLESKNMKYSLKIDEHIPGKLDMQLRQHLWLIFKEMVTNAARHSDAKQLDVIMNYEEGVLKLVVQDDGKGMDIDKVKKGNGLVNIQKRADLIDGDISLKTSEGFGTRWILKLSI